MHGNCTCGTDEFAGRNFLTKEEKSELLQDYKKWLDSESKGVDERIKEMKKAG